MANKKYSMETVRQVASLTGQGLSQERIGRLLKIPRSTVGELQRGYTCSELGKKQVYTNESGLKEETDFYSNFEAEWEKARTEIILGGFSNQWKIACGKIRSCAVKG